MLESRRVMGSCRKITFSSPEPTILSGLRQESRTLGATISGMRQRYRLRETGWTKFGYFLCYFKMVAPRALVFRPLVKGNEDSGNESGKITEKVLVSILGFRCKHSFNSTPGYMLTHLKV